MNLNQDAQREAPDAVFSRQDNDRSRSFDDGFDDAVGTGADGPKPPIKRRAPIACKRCALPALPLPLTHWTDSGRVVFRRASFD